MQLLGGEQPLSFPVTCKHRILADRGAEVRALILQCLREHDIQGELEQRRCSAQGRYVTYTVEVEYHSREELYGVMESIAEVTGVQTVI